MSSHGIMDEGIRNPRRQKELDRFLRSQGIMDVYISPSERQKILSDRFRKSLNQVNRYCSRHGRRGKPYPRHEIPLAALIEILESVLIGKYGIKVIRCIGEIASWPDSSEKEEAFQVILQWLSLHPPAWNLPVMVMQKESVIDEDKHLLKHHIQHNLEEEEETEEAYRWRLFTANKNEELQLAAIEEARYIGDPRASDLLFELMKQRYPKRVELVLALAQLGDSRIIDELTVILRSFYRFNNDDRRILYKHFPKTHGGPHGGHFEEIIGWLSNIDKEYTISKVVEFATTVESNSIRLATSAKALCEIGGIVALGEAIRMLVSPTRYKSYRADPDHSKQIRSLLNEQDANEVGRAYEHLGLLEEAEKWYTSKGLFDDTARVRKLIAEMGAAKVSQKVVQGNETITINKGDETITIQDSVVMESVGGIQATGLLEQLERLGQMKKDGLLSDEEFMLAKQKLLND
jgi:hypothetical protein